MDNVTQPWAVDNAEPEEHQYQYDLIVIGGGSGGLALAQDAAKFGKKIAVFDYVKPTPMGTTWGLGGTCVNVGCIPKKLMHQAALLGESLRDAAAFGWSVDPQAARHDWTKLVEGIQDHIGSLNWGYRVALRDKAVTYINAHAVFVDPHTIEATAKNGKVTQYTARRFVIAVGGRPNYLEAPGVRELCISSDDVFSMQTPPGKTLVVGASYVAMECAGFLAGLGYDVTLMARSIFLRGFDQQMAEMIADYMQSHGTKVIRPAIPISVSGSREGKKKVTWCNTETMQEFSDEFDTVLLAVGRRPVTDALHLDRVGVVYDPRDGKIPVVHERTNVPHIYALGDCIKGPWELTPVAIKTGRFLSRRLFGGAKLTMDYSNIPTTVFTPLEYGACGLSEEVAIERYGAENIEVFHSYYTPLEWTVAHRGDNLCYAKAICNKADSMRVVGFHVLGPNAGEITVGLAVAMKAGMTKATLDETVGIHPTTAEEFTDLRISKSSGEDAKKTGC